MSAPGHDTAPRITRRRDEPLTRDEMASLVASRLPSGSYVNLGIGQPTQVADHLRAEQDITLHTENGMLGMGPRPDADAVDPDLTNAGKMPVTELPGASYFHQADSFAMMRGGHIDICVLGAFQVSVAGDLANWHTGEAGAIPAVGGAMDLASGAREVWVVMSLMTKRGEPKLVAGCSYPLTAAGCVRRVFTDLATFHIDDGRTRVVETFGIDVRELAERLGGTIDEDGVVSAHRAERSGEGEDDV